MTNELVFIVQTAATTLAGIAALRQGKAALVAFMTTSWIAANWLITQQITLFGLDSVATNGIFIGSYIILTLTEEQCGKKTAQDCVRASTGGLIFFLLTGFFHLLHIPNKYDTMYPHFLTLFYPAPRIVISSIIVLYLSASLTVWLHNTLSKKMKAIPYALRSCIAVTIGQLFDTILFTVCALYGIVHSITQVCIVSFATKCAALIICSLTVHTYHKQLHA